MKIDDLSGKRFSMLKVISRAKNTFSGSTNWNCLCDCGNKCTATGQSLRNGHKKSCGCLQKIKAKERLYKHGLHNHPLYKVWGGMMQRCYNHHSTAFKDYGAKGIFVCNEWKNPELFIKWALSAGYKYGLTIERNNIYGGYSPENCCFISRADQNRNTSRTHKVFADGETLTTAQIAEIIGVSRSTAAKWYKNEGLRTFNDFVLREKSINNPRHIRSNI